VLYIYDELHKQTNSNTSWCATSRPPSMPLTATPVRPARWALRW
jgi:hypothetical protein